MNARVIADVSLRIWPKWVTPAAAFLLAALITRSPLQAGSIFDENWAPPRTTLPATRPGQAPLTPIAPNVQPPVPVGMTRARREVPGPGEQAKSRKLFKDVFATELADHSPAARRALAAKLLAQAGTVADAPTDEFVLLAGATDAAREGGDLSLCCKAADLMGEVFDVDALRVESDAAMKMTLRGATRADATENCRVGFKLAGELIAAEDYVTAGRLLTQLRAAEPVPEMLAQVQTQARNVETLRAAAERAAPYLEKLKSAPDDPAANLEAGRYYCFTKGDWERGLPLLAKGGDSSLKSLAQTELSKAQDTQTVAGLADGWWDVRLRETEIAKTNITLHAAGFYRAAHDDLKGIQRLQAEQRIAEAGKSPSVAKGTAHESGSPTPKCHYRHIEPNFCRAGYAPYIDDAQTKLTDGDLDRKGQVGWQYVKPNLIEFNFDEAVSPKSVRLWFRGNEKDQEVNVPDHVTVWSSADAQTRTKIGELTIKENKTGWVEIPLVGKSQRFVLDIAKTNVWTILGEVEFKFE